MHQSTETVPTLLAAMADGDGSAAERLFPLVYDELHRLASAYMKRERQDHTLQPTALINEAFVKLAQPSSDDDAKYENVDHFIATAAVIMRRILVNHAKAKKTEKRGGNRSRIEIECIASTFENNSIDLVSLDEAMERLAKIDPTQFRLVELRFFGGMSFEQCAKTLELSPRSVYYEWAHARAWLRNQLEGT